MKKDRSEYIAEKKAENKQKEKRFTAIAIVCIALTAVIVLGVIIYWPVRTAIENRNAAIALENKTVSDKENIQGCWYLKDNEAICWVFGQDTVARLERDPNTGKYKALSEAYYTMNVKNEMITLKLTEEDTLTFLYKIDGSTLTLTINGIVNVFSKGDAPK